MRKQGKLLFGIAGLGLAAVASPTAGSPITWEFAGELTLVRDDDGSLGGVFGVGTLFSGMFTFESTTPDSSPVNLGFGNYEGALTSVSGRVGAVPFLERPGLAGSITVFDDFGGDGFSVSAATEFLGASVRFGLTLGDSTGSIFSDDSLPLTPPDLGSLDLTVFFLALEPDGDLLRGELTQLTPDPGTLVLLLIGGSFVLRRKQWR